MSPRTPRRRVVADAVGHVLDSRSSYDRIETWFDAILELLPGDGSLDEQIIDLLELNVRGGYGREEERIRGEYDEHIHFWSELARRYPGSPKLLGFAADTCLLSGDVDGSMAQFLSVFHKDPVLVYKFGGELRDFMRRDVSNWLQYQLVLVKAALASGDKDYAVALYRELLDHYRDDEESLRHVRRLAIESGQGCAP